jgi:hypothetical protein
MDTSGKEAPEVIASEDVYRGRIFTVTLDTVREDGREHKRGGRAPSRQRGHRRRA